MEQLLLGATAVAAGFVGLFFLRFWVRTRDRFFLYFCASFWIEALHRLAQGLFAEFAAFTEANPLSFLVRLVAYGLIILAIYQKNRPPSKP